MCHCVIISFMKPILFRRIAELLSHDGCLLDALPDKASMLLHLNRTVLLLGLLFCSCHHAIAVGEDKYLFADETGQAISGSEIFLKYCAGCHGFDGLALYEHAPSFSMGERLHKSDQELLQSVVDGKHGMPHWDHKLSIDKIRSAIAYLRVMESRYSSGLPAREEPIPETNYKFKPVGEDDDYWLNKE